ncbi:hypothetical protein HLK59_23525 [Streptomyces sp. S3(2020)]|uniref:hypothetical protein n=1 Tax=Streptomyces sp. S3(2020) TaxID=2732044 RepID=UPI0014879621|nr:hypothetical protein [Streptomyces sp. S3(2020)]NNN33275.1 hypothetical protein [Streptomyces sp. S3(2020)]
MLNILKHLAISALISCVVWVAVTVLLALLAFGHLQIIRIVLRVRRGLARMPPGVVFHSRDNVLVLTAYNAAQDAEKNVPVGVFGWPSQLHWSSGAARSKATLRRKATAEAVWRAALFVLVTVPTFGMAGWLAATANPLWIYVVLFLVAHQILLTVLAGQVYIIKYAGLTYLTTYLFLHRTGLWWHPSPSLAAGLYFGFNMLSMAAVGWVGKSARAERVEAAGLVA